MFFIVYLELPSISVSGRGSIFSNERPYFIMNLESTKQLDDPESTSTGTSTGNREKQTRKLRE